MFKKPQMKNIEVNNQDPAISEQYWASKNEEVESEENGFFKHELPLARIRKLMRVEEDVKNVANEVPSLLSKATQAFIEEVTFKALDRAFHRKKRIVQKGDIHDVISSSQIYDFLHFLLPYNNQP